MQSKYAGSIQKLQYVKAFKNTLQMILFKKCVNDIKNRKIQMMQTRPSVVSRKFFGSLFSNFCESHCDPCNKVCSHLFTSSGVLNFDYISMTLASNCDRSCLKARVQLHVLIEGPKNDCGFVKIQNCQSRKNTHLPNLTELICESCSFD